MKNKSFSNSLAIVVGLGRSGIGAAKLLNQQGHKVLVIEQSNNEEVKQISKGLKNLGILVELGKPFQISSFQPWLKELSFVVISPSVPWGHRTVNELRDLGIKVQGEISLAWKQLKHIPWIGITGTNGKTTVTEMLGHILKENQLYAPAGGNVGTAASEIALQSSLNKNWLPIYLIMELSSYQIETAPEISPEIGIWTTFTPDHLERHKTLENYFSIKNSLLEKSSTRIYNADDEYLNAHRNYLKDGIWISTNANANDRKKAKYWINKEGVVLEENNKLFHSSILQIPGRHNLQNLLLVTAAAREIGLSPNAIEQGLKKFKGVPHRLEFIGEIEDIKIFNDSKATNYDSANVGLEALGPNTIVLAGGQAKQGDDSDWLIQINKSCVGVFLFGSSAKTLEQKIKKSGFKKDILICENLEAAVNLAMSQKTSEKISNILLSPACSSFDQYKDFEERGNHFKQLIKPFLNEA